MSCILYIYPFCHLFIVAAYFRPSQQFGQSVQIDRGRRIESGYQLYVMQSNVVALNLLHRLATQKICQTDLSHYRFRAARNNAYSLVGHQHSKILRAAAQTLIGNEEFGIVAIVNAVQELLTLSLLTIVRRQQSSRTADDTWRSVTLWYCAMCTGYMKKINQISRKIRSIVIREITVK